VVFENVDTPRDDTGVALPLPEITGDRTKERAWATLARSVP